MFFAILGVGVFTYCLIFSTLTLFVDCDLQLFFYEKFGKSPKKLKGKVVFVTGASSGIGESIAYALAQCGAKLVLSARRNEELQRVKRQCIELSKGQLQDFDVLVIPMDVTDFASHKNHFQHAIRHFGRVDVLINNAGRSQRAMWEEIELTVDKQMFDLNVFGPVHLTRVALEYFNKVGTGHIAVVSSLAGVMGVPFSGTYTGSKYAVHGYFNSLRNEKARRNIFVTLLCPGPTFTNFLQESFTGRAGEKYNTPVSVTDKRMTAQRCGYLSAVAIANKTDESWIAIRPLITVTYFAVYFPLLFNGFIKLFGPELLFKLRDSKKLEEMTKKD